MNHASERLHWGRSIPFFAAHAVAVATPFLAPFGWRWLLLAVGLYYVRMFGLTAGYHRYFSHRSFRTGRAFQFVLALLGTLSVQKGVLWWAAHHRDHHRYSDTPDDIHSPIGRGFWWSHVGWILCTRYDETKYARIKDLAKYPELVWLNQHYLVPPLALALGLYLVGGLPALLWGFFVSTVALWHGTFAINSLAHVIGRRRYETSDTSKNSFVLALVTMGEGWHNNHHFYASTANQGWFWWEIDLSYAILRALQSVGVVWAVRTPPRHVRHAHLASTPQASGPGPQEEPAPAVASLADPV
jgi:stearoyl-CoA desaturase (Delta-9 desaturase)